VGLAILTQVLPGRTAAGPAFEAALDELRQRVSRAYLHIDLDVLDTSEGRANRFAAEGGLSLAELERAIELAFERLQVDGAATTAYDPSLDEDGRMARAALDVIRTVAHEALGQRAG
jgi:arginase